MSTKRCIHFLAILAILTLFLAWLPGAQAQDEPVRLGMSVSTQTNPFYQALAQGVADEGEALGAEVTVLSADDQLEKQIIPALRAGMVCITDRYIYSMIARAVVRGVDEEWIKSVFSFALVPDAVFYLRAEIPDLLPRVLNSGGFDYWESGMDFLLYDDAYESWTEYQALLIRQLDAIAAGYSCTTIDAGRPVHEVFFDLRDRIAELLVDMRPARLGKRIE